MLPFMVTLSAKSTYLSTDVQHGHDYMWMTVDKTQTNFITFRIKAASDCHVVLAPVVGEDEQAYEVVIGGWHNTKSAIWNPAHIILVAEVETEGILAHDEWRSFWIRYEEGHIEVGTGLNVGLSRFLYWHDNSTEGYRTVKAVSVATGFDYFGEWDFNHIEGILNFFPF